MLSFRACGHEVPGILSFRPHICAVCSGRTGAAARITILGCIFLSVEMGMYLRKASDYLIQTLVAGRKAFAHQKGRRKMVKILEDFRDDIAKPIRGSGG